MDPKQYSMFTLLFPAQDACFQIPPFQRNYQWRLEQIHRLIRDIKSATASTENRKHWLGVALLAPATTHCPVKNKRPGHNCFDVLDGQQRLLTFRIWIAALVDEYQRQLGKEPEIYNRKDLLSISVHGLDQASWERLATETILGDTQFDQDGSSDAIARAYWYSRYLAIKGEQAIDGDEPIVVPFDRTGEESLIKYWIESGAAGEVDPLSPLRIEELIRGTLEDLSLTCLEHEPDKDEPVEIVFETLNSERQALGQFDLLRNFILIESTKTGKAQNKLYQDYLLKAEREVSKAPLDFRAGNLERFLYDYLIGRGASASGASINLHDTARIFRRMWHNQTDFSTVDEFFDKEFVPSMYGWLAAASGSDKFHDRKSEFNIGDDVTRKIWRIESLSRGPFTPVVAKFLTEWRLSGATKKSATELASNLHLLETYIVRSLLAGVPFSPMRREMMQLCVGLFSDRDVVLEEWVKEKSPTDSRIEQVLTQSVMKGKKDPDPSKWILKDDFGTRIDARQIRAVFDGLTAHLEGSALTPRLVPRPGSRERGSAKKVTVEHLYPQNPAHEWGVNLRKWGSSLERMQLRLHSIGNITVLPEKVNQTLSNKPLEAKQEGLSEKGVPIFKITKDFMDATQWTHVDIDKRTLWLTESCINYWSVA